MLGRFNLLLAKPGTAATETLDTDGVAVAGSDVLGAARVTLDTGAITVAGSDALAAASSTLDTGAVAAAGGDASAALRVTLDTAAAAVAGSEVAASGPVTASLDTGAVTVAGDSVEPTVVSLDTGGSGNRGRRRPMVKTLEEQRAENDAIVEALLRRVAGPTPAEQAAILARQQDEEAVLTLLLAA